MTEEMHDSQAVEVVDARNTLNMEEDGLASGLPQQPILKSPRQTWFLLSIDYISLFYCETPSFLAHTHYMLILPHVFLLLFV